MIGRYVYQNTFYFIYKLISSFVVYTLYTNVLEVLLYGKVFYGFPTFSRLPTFNLVRNRGTFRYKGSRS